MPALLLGREVFLWNEYLMDKEEIMATIKIKQTNSRIGAPVDQKRTLDALGLRKMNHVVEREATPSILGMVYKVRHLVTVIQ